MIAALCVLLAACEPAVVYVTPPPLGPAELQRLSDSATNTAAAVAAQSTQEAHQAAAAAATDHKASDRATQARAATQDALAGLQTESAMRLTQGAGDALATDAASAKTQAAAQTQAYATPTAAAMRAAATSTAQAQRTQAAADAMDFARQQAEAASWAEFWATVRAVVIALLVVGGLAAIVVVVVDRWTRIRLAQLRETASVAREAFKVLPPGHWAEWQPGDGYQVYTLPGALDEPARIIDARQQGSVPSGPSQVHAWRQSVRLFCWWGDRYGFSLAKMGAAGAGVVTDPAWRKLSKLLKDAGVLADMAVEGQKGRVTDWAGGWSFARLTDELKDGRLALPFPPEDEAPKVAFAVPTQHQN